MKNWFLYALLAIALGVTVAQSQPRGVTVYSRLFTPLENARVEYSSDAGGDLDFSLERLSQPESVLLGVKDWRTPAVPDNARSVVVKRVTVKGKGGYEYGEAQFGRLELGVYIVRARQGNTPQSRSLLIVSSLGLIVKRSDTEALTWTVDSLTGKPVKARVYALETGKTAVGVIADSSGLTKSKLAAKEDRVYLAQFGASWALSGANIASWNRRALLGYVYSDRPVYRPGDTVGIKGILRDGRSLAAKASAALRVRVLDQANNLEVYRGVATTNANGSFALSVDLPNRARTGQYVVQASVEGDGGTVNGLFKVESYQKPEFSVTVTLPARAVQGEGVTAKISAAYLFSGKVSGARVKYNVQRRVVYDYWWYASRSDQQEAQAEQRLEAYQNGYDYGDGEWWQPPAQTIISESGRLDENGELSLPLPLSQDKQGFQYTVSASVEDETRQVVTGSATLSAQPSSRSVSIRSNGYSYSVGQPVDLQLETLDLNDKGIASDVKVNVQRETWNDNTKENTELQILTLRTDANGRGTATFTPRSSGYYRFTAGVQDEKGRVASSQSWVWVVGSENEVWSYRFSELSITLDKARYEIGETVTALIQNPRPGTPVLVTLEGTGLEAVRVLRGVAPVLRYQFKATQGQTPNIFIAAAMMSAGRTYSSAKRVLIDDPAAKLAVAVSIAKPRFAPGETTTLGIKTSNSSGKGVPAEVSLAVVDEGIYLVQPDTVPEIGAFFHRPRGNAVGTEFSSNWYFRGAPRLESQAAPSAVAAADSSNAVSKRSVGQANEPRVRQDFKDTALWVAQVQTGADGTASVQLKLPDNLTTWRVTAKGITRNSSAGELRKPLLVTQDIVARIGVPRNLVRGDQTQASLVMNNNSTSSQPVTLELKSTGIKATSRSALAATVAAGGRSTLRVGLSADLVGTAKLQGRAVSATTGDALEIPVTVKARGFTQRNAFSSDTTAGEQVVNVAQDAALETMNLRVLVTPSLTAAVAPALEYLVGYPYGCSEQTMSRFLPALLASRTLGKNDLNSETIKKLPEYVKIGIERLEGFQHDDGGWGFWQYDDSGLEMSAYVMGGLLRAKALDAKVSAATLERGLKYLQTAANRERYSRNDRSAAYLSLSIAAAAPLEAMRRFAGQDALEPSVLARMAIAFSRAGQAQDATDALDRLKAVRVETPRGITWRNPNGGRQSWWSWDDNPVTATALALEALGRIDPNSPLIPKVAAWLLTERQGARWVSTRDTAAVIEAALSLNEPRSDAPIPVTVFLNGDPIKTLSVVRQATLELSGKDALLKKGRNTVELRGDTRLLYSTDVEYTREPTQLIGASNGLSITRNYEKLEAKLSGDGYIFVPQSLMRVGILEPVTVGEYLLVTLKISAKDARYVMLSDAIPAGFKALESRALPIIGQRFQYPWEWSWNYWFSGLDIRDDRVDVYAERLSGTQTVQYILRAETPGKYTALPAQGFLMYEPSVNGRSSGATLTVRDRGQ